MSIGNKHFKSDRLSMIQRAIQEGASEQKANSRTRGTTTAIALETIAKAMKNPGTPIKIEDHINTHESHKVLSDTIHVVLEDLGLVGFVMSVSRRTLTYELDYVYEGWKL